MNTLENGNQEPGGGQRQERGDTSGLAGLTQPTRGPALGDLYKRVSAEEAAFVRAAALLPHDDRPRLEYADWLDRVGLADWAHSIRSACDCDRNGQFWLNPGNSWAPFDPFPFPVRRWGDPVGLVKWWVGRTESAALLGTKFLQVRGLPGYLNLNRERRAELLRSEFAVFDAFPVTSVFLHESGDRQVIEQLLTHPRTTQIDELELSGCSPVDMSILSAGKRLRRLDLSGTPLGVQKDLGFLRTGYDALQVLNVSGKEIADRALEAVVGCTGLRSLDLCGSAVTTAGVAGLRALNRLEELKLPACRLVTSDVLQHLGTLRRLTRLDLTESSMDDRGLEHLAHFPSLKVLVLHDCPGVTDRGADVMVSLAREGHLSQLRGLYLDGSGITSTGRRRLGRVFDRRVRFG